MKINNYLIVGSGLFGAVFAHEAAKHGNQVTIIEKSYKGIKARKRDDIFYLCNTFM